MATFTLGGHGTVPLKVAASSIEIHKGLMVDIFKLRTMAIDLRSLAEQFRQGDAAIPHRVGALEAGVLEDAAKGLKDAADEIEHLRTGKRA